MAIIPFYQKHHFKKYDGRFKDIFEESIKKSLKQLFTEAQVLPMNIV
jgi:isocitrate dehydrogenase